MSPDDIISTFQLFEESKATATKHLAMHGSSSPKTNLALNAKHMCKEEQSDEEEYKVVKVMRLTQMRDHEDIALFVKKFSA